MQVAGTYFPGVPAPPGTQSLDPLAWKASLIMPRPAAPSRSLRSFSRTEPFEIITATPKHPVMRVLGLLVRLRAELFVATVCLTVWVLLTPAFVDVVPAPGAAPVSTAVPGTGLVLPVRITVCVLVVALLVGLPWTRRYLVRRAAAVITRHRLRQTLIECRVVNFSRACPVFLWSRPTRVGEAVWLILRAGISVDNVADRAPEIAAGCFAREARVTARTSMVTLVCVEVIRRDPLAPESISSDLGPWAVGWDSPVIPVGATPATLSAEAAATAPTETQADATPAAELVPAARDGHTESDTPATTPGRGGDWSDYV